MSKLKGESYEVEDVIDKKLINGVLMYQVKWKGYPMSQCTWEKIENFENLDKIRAYEDSLQVRPTGSSKKSKRKIVQIDESLNQVIDMNQATLQQTPNKPASTTKKETNGYLNKKRSRSKQSKSREKEKKGALDDMSAKEKQLKSSIRFSVSKEQSPGVETREGKLELDVPLRIKSALQSKKDPASLLCEIEWKEGKNKETPANSYYTNDKIKAKYPLLLIEYYERHLIFPKKKSK